MQKLAYEAIQEMRVKARWEALNKESIQIAKACGKTYHAPVFENGDSRKQLLTGVYICIRKNHYGPNHNVFVPVSCSESIRI